MHRAGKKIGGRSRPGRFDMAPPADRVPRPHAIRLHDFPLFAGAYANERTPKSLRNQKGAARLVSCAAREPHA